MTDVTKVEIKLPGYCKNCPTYGGITCDVALQKAEILAGRRTKISINEATLEYKCGSLEVREHRAAINDLVSLSRNLREQVKRRLSGLQPYTVIR